MWRGDVSVAGICPVGWMIAFLQLSRTLPSFHPQRPAEIPSGFHGWRYFTVAQQVAISLVDDIDGSPAKETVQFNLDNRGPYEIDLNGSNASRLRDALAPFVAAARRAGGRTQRPAPARQASGRSREETQEIREWLRANGWEVSDRGRIRSDQLSAYANKTPAPAQEAKTQAAPPAKGKKPKAPKGSNAVEFQAASTG
jgi:hypothetical protein